MKSKNQTTEVITVEAEEIPLEKVIDTALVKQNVTDTVIANLKKEFGSLRLKSIDDKESYLEVKEAKKNVRKVGILVEKVCKKGREDAVAIQKAWLAKERSVLAQIAEVEDPLQKEIDKYESEQSRKEQQEIQRKENAYMQRQSSLLKLGANYANGCIILDEITYETDTIKNAEDDFFDDIILPKYKARYEIKESARIAEEKRREEESKRITAEREALEKERKEIEEARESIRIQKESEQKRIHAIRNAELRPFIVFIRDYSNMLNMDEDAYQKELSNIKIGAAQQWEYDREQAAKKRLEDEERSKELQAAADKKRLEQIEMEKTLAIERERQRVAKENEELEAKRLADEFFKAEELAASSDKVKWANIVEYLNATPLLGMKSNSYKQKIGYAKKKIIEIVNL